MHLSAQGCAWAVCLRYRFGHRSKLWQTHDGFASQVKPVSSFDACTSQSCLTSVFACSLTSSNAFQCHLDQVVLTPDLGLRPEQILGVLTLVSRSTSMKSKVLVLVLDLRNSSEPWLARARRRSWMTASVKSCTRRHALWKRCPSGVRLYRRSGCTKIWRFLLATRALSSKMAAMYSLGFLEDEVARRSNK